MINGNDDIKKIENDIYTNILSNVMDPEIELDIINLGLIYKLKYDGKNMVEILMTLSTPACPLSDAIIQNIKESIKRKYPSFNINVILTFDPLWNTNMISDYGKKKLGM